MFDFVGKRNFYYLLSLLVLIPGVISLLIPPALKPGIEFSSGTTFTARFQSAVDEERSALRDGRARAPRGAGAADEREQVPDPHDGAEGDRLRRLIWVPPPPGSGRIWRRRSWIGSGTWSTPRAT